MFSKSQDYNCQIKFSTFNISYEIEKSRLQVFRHYSEKIVHWPAPQCDLSGSGFLAIERRNTCKIVSVIFGFSGIIWETFSLHCHFLCKKCLLLLLFYDLQTLQFSFSSDPSLTIALSCHFVTFCSCWNLFKLDWSKLLHGFLWARLWDGFVKIDTWISFLFIGPESDHWECLSVTP